jgi:transketolase
VSTFAAFFSRAYDQVRMGAIGNSHVNFVGSHCGVSIGEDGMVIDILIFNVGPS